MNRQEFEELLNRYTTGECTQEEKDMIDKWFQDIKLKPEFELTEQERDLTEAKILVRIEKRIGKESQKSKKQKSVKPGAPFTGNVNTCLIYIGFAASLILILFSIQNTWKTIGTKISHERSIVSNNPAESIYKINNTSDL